MNLPNQLTLARIVLSPVFMGLILIEDTRAKLLSLVVFVIAALTDLGDGYFARRRGLATGFGKFMDPLADKILTSTALISFVTLGYVRGWMVTIIIGREFFITGFRSLAAYRGMIIVPTLGAKFKTLLQMVTICVILLFVYLKATLPSLGYHWEFLDSQTTVRAFDWLMGANVVVTVITGLDYLVRNFALLKNVMK